eukprot:6762533-Pyramimonas_sp.AAC.1
MDTAARHATLHLKTTNCKVVPLSGAVRPPIGGDGQRRHATVKHGLEGLGCRHELALPLLLVGPASNATPWDATEQATTEHDDAMRKEIVVVGDWL